MKAYKVKNNRVVEVVCSEIKYPLKDSDGDTIYQNSHFPTKKEATENAIINCKAGVDILTRNVRETREKVRELEVKLADECIDLQRLEKELKHLKED